MEIANPNTRSRVRNRVTEAPDPFDGARHVAAEDRGVGFEVDIGVLDLSVGGISDNGAVADQNLVRRGGGGDRSRYDRERGFGRGSDCCVVGHLG